MLVLSRHKGERIQINDNITVTVVEIRGDKVRLGIEAPDDVPVHRQEVYAALQRENAKLTKHQQERVDGQGHTQETLDPAGGY
jgi:carbon storage regulator